MCWEWSTMHAIVVAVPSKMCYKESRKYFCNPDHDAVRYRTEFSPMWYSVVCNLSPYRREGCQEMVMESRHLLTLYMRHLLD